MLPDPTILDSKKRLWRFEVTEVSGSLADAVKIGSIMIDFRAGNKRTKEWQVFDLRKGVATGWAKGRLLGELSDAERVELKLTQGYNKVEIGTRSQDARGDGRQGSTDRDSDEESEHAPG